MTRCNHPVYRRGRERFRQINCCLNLLAQYHAGCLSTQRERTKAELLERSLTGLEKEYLSCYYERAMTHSQIARLKGRNPSSVTRGILRAEEKLERAMKQLELMEGQALREAP